MTEQKQPASAGNPVVAVGEVIPPAARGTKAGSTEALKSLHADLTEAYQQYLELAKLKPQMLNPSMLALIQQFLRHNEITAEAPQASERDTLQRRLDTRRKARGLDSPEGRITLNHVSQA